MNSRDQITGDNATTTFSLTRTSSTNGVIVIVSGVVKDATMYAVIGKTIVFNDAPPSPPPGQVTNIEVVFLARQSSPLAARWNVPIADNTGTPNVMIATINPVINALVENDVYLVSALNRADFVASYLIPPGASYVFADTSSSTPTSSELR